MPDQKAKLEWKKVIRLRTHQLWMVSIGMLIVFCHCTHAKTISAGPLVTPVVVTICGALLIGAQYKRFCLNAFWMIAFALMLFCLDAESGITSPVAVLLGAALGYFAGARFPTGAGIAVAVSSFITAAISGIAFTERHWTNLSWSLPLLLPTCLTGVYWSQALVDQTKFKGQSG